MSSVSLKDDGTVDKTYYSVGRGNFPSVSLSELKDEDLYTYTTDPKVSFDRVRDEKAIRSRQWLLENPIPSSTCSTHLYR